MQEQAKVFSLSDVCLSIQKTLNERYKSTFWVKAEMNKLNFYPHSGHCYPELVEKRNGKVVAQLRANLWKDDYLRANNNFKRIIKEPLKDGITILFCAAITFDPSHGLALRILEIDPAYSLGELEREKFATIDKLREEGLFTRNKTQNLALLPKRIAIISVETSRGYADFMQVIQENPWGYRFYFHLFPALLQGEKAVESLVHQLQRIRKVTSYFDAVAIIRGGGGDVGLSCYNDYKLSREIASFPLPVITGIGHSTNETVAEMLAFENAITPTKLAEYLIQKFHNFSVPVKRANEKLADSSLKIIREEKLKLKNSVRFFRSVTTNMLRGSASQVDAQRGTLQQQLNYLFKTSKSDHVLVFSAMKKASAAFCNNTRKEVSGLEKSVRQMNPENVIKRGFSITLLNGKAVRSVRQLKENDKLETLLIDGLITSTVNTIKDTGDHE